MTITKNIIGFEHYKNDSLNGYGLMLNENFRPKYLFEKNNGKRDGVIIEFMKMELLNRLGIRTFLMTVKESNKARK